MALTDRLEIDAAAWDAGFVAGVIADMKCPYAAGTREAWAWRSGWIEGRASATTAPAAPAEPIE